MSAKSDKKKSAPVEAPLKRSIAYGSVFQFLSLAFPFIVAPYLSRTIGVEGMGIYSYSQSVAYYFVLFTHLGLNIYGSRVVASCRSDEKARTKAFWSLFAVQSICFFISAALYLMYCGCFAENKLAALIQGLYVLSAWFDFYWFFCGIEQFRLLALRIFFVRLVSAVLIFLFVQDSNSTYTYIAIMAGGSLVVQVASLPVLIKYVGFYRPTVHDVLPHFKPSLVIFASSLAISIYGDFTKVLLGGISGMESVGFLDAAIKIVRAPALAIDVVTTVMLSRTAALYSEGKDAEVVQLSLKTMIVVTALACLMAFGFPSIATPFVRLYYGAGFEQSVVPLMVLCITPPLLGFSSIVNHQYLLPRGKEGVVAAVEFCGAGICLVVVLILVPYFGAIGAAIGIVSAHIVNMGLYAFIVRKEFPVKQCLQILLSFALIGLFMAVIVGLLPEWGNPWLDIVVRVGIGLAIYVPLALVAMKGLVKRNGISP